LAACIKQPEEQEKPAADAAPDAGKLFQYMGIWHSAFHEYFPIQTTKQFFN
jgi:hypothetical protein